MNAQSPLRRRREIILSPRLGETLIVEMINAFAWAPLFAHPALVPPHVTEPYSVAYDPADIIGIRGIRAN
jgi:hypothetical protein